MLLLSNGMLRRLVGATGISITLDSNDNIAITATGGGSGGIPASIATFAAYQLNLKQPTVCESSLIVAGAVACSGTFNTGGSIMIQGGAAHQRRYLLLVRQRRGCSHRSRGHRGVCNIGTDVSKCI